MLGIILIASIAMKTNATENVTCFMNKIEAVHSTKNKISVRSDHSINITNSGAANTYRIEYRNQFMNGGFWTDNNRQQYDIKLLEGKSYTESSILTNDLMFSKSQSFETQAVTTITMNGKILKQCLNKNVAIIY